MWLTIYGNYPWVQSIFLFSVNFSFKSSKLKKAIIRLSDNSIFEVELITFAHLNKCPPVWRNPFHIGWRGGGGGFPPSFFSMSQKVINTTCSIFVTFNKIELDIFCQKNQGPKPYLSLSTAFFVTWPWKYQNKKCNFRG